MAWGALPLLAGPNGAGKSTLYRGLHGGALLDSYVMLNADDRTLARPLAAGYDGFAGAPQAKLKELFIQSANEVFDEALAWLRGGQNVCVETFPSTAKYCGMVEAVIEGGGRFELFYAAVHRSGISWGRTAARVRNGGHDVPPDRVAERWKRSLTFLPWFAARAHGVMIDDNSAALRVSPARGGDGKLEWQSNQVEIFPELRAVLCEAFPNPNPS
jgi:predicted ABC-type ATPase